MSTYSHAKYLVITNIDILPIILSYVDKKSLLSSSLVSHYFNTVSTKILYSKVNLKNVKNVDSFLHTLDRTTHYNLYNTIHTNEYLVNNIHSITMDSPNLAYLSGEKLSKCISECRKLKEVIIGNCTLSQKKFLFSLSNLCKTQRKISITQQPEEPETDYPGVDLVFTNDSLEILLDNCKNIGQILNTFYLNMDVDNSDIINPNRIEELILNRINISSDNLNLIC
ncbi:21719_t:CDS:2 [Rhizophagus irregularis]|nr:21719_t:CDS:2 [Rhizophagus irregularis]